MLIYFNDCYINKILSFSYDEFNSRSNDSISSDNRRENNIIILKRVKSIRQLKNSDKERVRLCYKEAILKGFTIVKDIQCYIASKSKIWIERTGIEYLKKSEEVENKKWYYYMAKDHFAYVGVYRKAIDELEQIKKELWAMMMDQDTSNMEKVQITKELHNLTKTYTLLLRDLPFISNLTKYYDLGFMEHKETENPQGNKENRADEIRNEEIIEHKVSERLNNLINESGLYNLDNKNMVNTQSSVHPDKKMTDEVMDDMQSQLDNDHINKLLESKEYHESVRKIKEILDD